MREYTVIELAKLMGVNEETVRRWRIRGRNGVQLMVPSAGDRPGRKGYRISEDALRRFLSMNPSLITPELEDALGEERGTLAYTLAFRPETTSPEPVMSASGSDESLRPDAPERDPMPAARERTPDDPVARERAVMHQLLNEKLALREDLLRRLDQVDEEIAVLRMHCADEGAPSAT